jgi:hypothetical protein
MPSDRDYLSSSGRARFAEWLLTVQAKIKRDRAVTQAPIPTTGRYSGTVVGEPYDDGCWGLDKSGFSERDDGS